MKTSDGTRLLLTAVVLGLLVGCASSSGPAPTEQAPGAPEQTAEAPEQSASSPDPAQEEEELLNRLKWTTATEVDNFGFDIYRSLSEDGPFERITAEPMPGAGTVDEPTSYEFLDEEIDPSRDYYYYIESISIDGVREIFSPIMKAPAKRPKQDPSE